MINLILSPHGAGEEKAVQTLLRTGKVELGWNSTVCDTRQSRVRTGLELVESSWLVWVGEY